MATEFRLPQLTESMAVVKLSTWLKREGDTVSKGEPIAEVETDKTNVELEAPESGVIGKIHVPAGSEGVAPGTLLATIGAEGDAAGEKPKAEAAAKPAPAPAAKEAPKEPARADERAAAPLEMGNRTADISGPTEAVEAPGRPAAAPAGAAAGGRPHEQPRAAKSTGHAGAVRDDGMKVSATALASRMAQVAGLDLSSIPAADGRRVMKADVEAVLKPLRPKPANGEAARDRSSGTAPAPAKAAYQDQPLTAMRRVTAQRLQQAKQTVPHFYLQADCRADALLDLRKQINESAANVKITVTDLIVAACAAALKKIPAANSSWVDGVGVRVYESIDIAIAVNTPQGLITPIVRDCGRKSIAAISRDLKDLSERARGGKLKPEEYSNGTFTISNLGMFGVTSITPIVNPPQSCILGVGATEAKPVVQDGQVVAGKVMSVTLAADHRAIDGALGAELLSEIRKLIESPMAIVFNV